MSDRGIETRKVSLPAHHSPLTRVAWESAAHQKVGAEDPLPDHLCLTAHNAFSSFPVARFGLEITPNTSWIVPHVNAQKRGKAGLRVDPRRFRPMVPELPFLGRLDLLHFLPPSSNMTDVPTLSASTLYITGSEHLGLHGCRASTNTSE
jgi:hypothetical protein